ncbi:MAG: sterol desaturase family protein [Alphaproteobacteria bacterium]|nr:sterol desaturase family protein [Alphaproteobacteria bacterium]
MELKDIKPDEKLIKFRKSYREQIDGWYNGSLHVAIIYSIGGLLLFHYINNINNIIAWELIIIPVTFIICNIFEWALHKYVMHKPQNFPGARAIYSRHTQQHHQFFSKDEMRFAGSHDWRVTFFPPYALIVFTLISIPGLLILSWLFTPNTGWLFIITTTSMYLIYESMHFCCHVGDNFLLRNLPFVNTLRRHHAAHHDQGVMTKINMNLTFPIADWLFKTSDLDRSLLGHLLNGYSEKHKR